MIKIDSTIVIQFINFVVTIVFLNYLLIKPVREQIGTRNKLITGYANEIATFTESANQKIASYEAALTQARSNAIQAREAVKAEAITEEHKIIAQAQAEAQAFVAQSRQRVAKESQQATQVLLSRVDDFAAKAMNKIFG
ncbi:ATP synthase F0 subunit B [Desulfovibrio cuneatus]|uniref:ATP synthase F0 subunit B n=1 Tax=Desulfovibrio cuneatus TaxID=159728 RepID=UPI000481253B|nr:ATP synthase F0 subunit B [Desulfovibrio cuneatus]